MEIPIKISQFAKMPKLLPSNKIIRSSAFTAKQLSTTGMISKDEETISAGSVGTMVDYLTRSILLADDHAFDVANIQLKKDFDQGLVSPDDLVKVVDEEEQLKEIAKATSEINDVPDEVFKIARDVCAWEEAYRSGMYVKPETYPDRITISHIREMLKRVEHFFEEYGWPTKDAFIASTKNNCLAGEGDYLLKDILVDLKVSNAQSMQIYWVRQLLVYYTLGFYNHFNDEQINCLMIYNARTDTVYFVKIADIDKTVFDFINDTAEKQSKENERVLKWLGIEIKGKDNSM
ncbi:hypothetical protein [Lactobacillus ultunensis]|uniref:Uncharacterized protein n=1 Tax=Lactobacillus ultunensis DSM 16047 TaxID=525365 RepID=C2EN47_9LACO|nr:hypothetical protein [Lactobacillus ultunensis]EEJ72043.1 hypothetical protein HMPREF0548_1093 [Lactobacillus ultunensis DSM 16047]KRL82124.1 hypothetical protein FC57_GL002069 [Lactobacillus ultunensis DSM 16047]QQP29581.1 hypothetical protein H4B44_10815 [Lactobacillus ultunensis]